MNNLQEAKESLAKSSQLNSIISPPKTKRIKLPTQRDINMIEQLINNKLNNKRTAINNEFLTKARTKWASKINAIHSEAIDLKKKINILNKEIVAEGYGTIQIHPGYSYYWEKLPATLREAQETEILEIDKFESPAIEALEKESTDLQLDIKLGLKPISDVKALLEKIDNIK